MFLFFFCFFCHVEQLKMDGEYTNIINRGMDNVTTSFPMEDTLFFAINQTLSKDY